MLYPKFFNSGRILLSDIYPDNPNKTELSFDTSCEEVIYSDHEV